MKKFLVICAILLVVLISTIYAVPPMRDWAYFYGIYIKNKITTVGNDNLVLDPNGSGRIVLNKTTDVIGDANVSGGIYGLNQTPTSWGLKLNTSGYTNNSGFWWEGDNAILYLRNSAETINVNLSSVMDSATLLTNGNFNLGDMGWTKGYGWTIIDQGGGDYEGVATAATENIYQPISVITGYNYVITYRVTSFTSGYGVTCVLSGSPHQYGTWHTTSGVYSEAFIANTTGIANFGITPGPSASTFRVDDIVVYESYPSYINSSVSIPGTGTRSERFGHGATASVDESTVIGYVAAGIISGYNGSTIYGGNPVAIGYKAIAGGVAIGYKAQSLNFEAVAIGPQSRATAPATIAIGDAALAIPTGPNGNQIVMGDVTWTTGNINYLIGGGCGTAYDYICGFACQGSSASYDKEIATADHQGFLGWYQHDSSCFSGGVGLFNDWWLGGPVQASAPHAITLNIPSALGTNVAGVDFTINGSKATGNAASGDIIFTTGNVGISGSTLQTATEKFRIVHTTGELKQNSSTLSAGVINASATWDPNSLAVGTQDIRNVPAVGAALGDFVMASFSIDVTNLQLTSYVQAADNIRCVMSNTTNGVVDLGSGIVYVRVIKK